jgi:ParB family chromosome partitioning protein
MLERAGVALRSGEIVEAPHYEFSPLPNQPRKFFNPETHARLVDSMRSPLGQIFEGLARVAPPGSPTKYELIDGERRWRAARVAGIPYRARIITIDDETLPYILAAVANFNRDSLSTPDLVKAMGFLLKLGASWKEVSEMFGMSVQWLQKLYTLTNLTDQVWDLMNPERPQSQTLGPMAAMEIARLHKSKQYPIALRVLEHRMTTTAVRHEVTQEVTRTKTGTVRVKRAPRKTWQSVVNRIGFLDRLTSDLELILQGEDVDDIFQGRSSERITRLLTQLQAATDRTKTIRVVLVNHCIVAPETDVEQPTEK